MEPNGGITVTSDAAHRVVIQIRDEAYPDRLIQCRLSVRQARELSSVLALKAHQVDAANAT